MNVFKENFPGNHFATAGKHFKVEYALIKVLDRGDGTSVYAKPLCGTCVVRINLIDIAYPGSQVHADIAISAVLWAVIVHGRDGFDVFHTWYTRNQFE